MLQLLQLLQLVVVLNSFLLLNMLLVSSQLCLYYAHISLVPRPAPFLIARRTCTTSDEKLVGAWERGYAHVCMTFTDTQRVDSVTEFTLVLGGAAVG